MKRYIFALLLIMATAFSVNAQKLGYVNTEKILSQMPEYQVAQEKLNALAKECNQRVESEFDQIEKLYNNYMAVRERLTAAQRTEREEEIFAKERAANELRNQYFGQDGQMQRKSEELMNPIKEKVQSVIDKIAENENFIFIFDLSVMQGIMYNNPQYDLTSRVMEMVKEL